MDLLRFATAGSVDDGKSTLIGRLLYDSKQIFEDQLEAVEQSSVQRGFSYTNLALLVDGLRAEREQGITIDVAYRYFATPQRKFIIADTPGHVQYTRNMVTGASTADLAVVLVDARKGLLEQSRRHAFIATLLRIPHIVMCVNKMDLVDWDESVYAAIKDEFRHFATRLDITDLTFVPISALHGDNVVERSPNMPWFRGLPLLNHLEEVHIASDRNLIDCRFPVQYVLRPYSDSHHDFRGYAGQMLGGVIRPGDEVVVLPSGFESRVASVETFDGPVDEAFPPMSVVVRLTDDLDVSRGDMICRPHNQPHVGQDVEAMVCWMSDRPMSVGGRFALKHTTRWARAIVRDIRYRLDVNSLHREEGVGALGLNEIGRVTMRVTAPLMFDEYRRNRYTGSFILVDEATNATMGAGMILGPYRGALIGLAVDDHQLAADIARRAGDLLTELREELDGTDPARLRAEGDRRSNILIQDLLHAARPGDAVLSEEAVDDPARLDARRVWIVDPLDGTREFAEPGRTDWAVHVALWEDGELAAGAVALPALGHVYGTGSLASSPMPRPTHRLRIAVSRSRPPAFVSDMCEMLSAEPVPMGSAGAKTMAVVDGAVDAYVHAGGQYEWDSAAPAAVARAAGLHTSRLDGSNLVYNRADPLLPDLVICWPAAAEAVLSAAQVLITPLA